MNYNSLIEGIRNYGSTNDEICSNVLGVSSDKIHSTVLIAPWWEPTALPNLGEAELVSSPEVLFATIKVWNIKNNQTEFSYIKTGFGAPLLMDSLLTLGLTKCKKIIFIGSAGALDSSMKIGDIVIPEYSICGDGASRYIASDDMRNDIFGEKTTPDSKLLEQLIAVTEKICNVNHVKYHVGKAFSSDTIFAQYAHLNSIINMGCNVIEMETASAFRASKLMNIPIVALFSISDNATANESLMSGRFDDEKDYRKFVKKKIIPEIIHNLIDYER